MGQTFAVNIDRPARAGELGPMDCDITVEANCSVTAARSQRRASLVEALQQLDRLLAVAEQLEVEIARQRQVAATLMTSLPVDLRCDFEGRLAAPKDNGLTEAVRDALRASGDWMTASEIKHSLISSGFDFQHYKSNPNSSIHKVARRMMGTAVEIETNTKGISCYRWKSNRAERAPSQPSCVVIP